MMKAMAWSTVQSVGVSFDTGTTSIDDFESGTTAAAHLAPWADWIDLDGHLHISNDDFTGLQIDAEGRLHMPERPGIGAVAI